MTRWRRSIITTAVVAIGLWPLASRAETTQVSPTYSINESEIGGIGDIPTSSSNTVLNPSGDTYVLSTSSTTNFGTANPLDASNGSYKALLDFNTSGIPATATINSVTLKLHATTTMASGGLTFYSEPATWSESTVTWATQPTTGVTLLATSATPVSGSDVTVSLPVSSVTAGGSTDYAVQYSVPAVIAQFASREDATNPPVLTVNWSSSINLSDGSTLGDNFIGNSSSTNFQSNAGFNTTADPSLTFSVDTASVNLGVLSTTVASTGTADFSVIDYTSYGYVVTIVGSPPQNGAKTLTALGTDTASVAGSEQFGINTVANTSPVSVGSNPVEDQNNTSTVIFGFGVAGDGSTGTFGTTRPYTIANKYRFNTGEVIASSPKSSGKTSYRISFLANISPTTNGGAYQSNITLVATGRY